MTRRMERAAQKYAALGWAVLPVQPGKKTPLLKGWQDAATCDPDQIRGWWAENPDANVGVATGPASGVFILDIDGSEGEASLFALEAEHGPLPELYPQQFTGSGEGWQAIFVLPEGRAIKNSAGKLGAGIDIRGAGGFAVMPPSIHPSGGRYVWAEDRNPVVLPPEPAPEWLVNLADPPKPARTASTSTSTSAAQGGRKRGPGWYAAALENELTAVASAPEGQRNHTLNRAAFALLRFTDDGSIPADVVWRGLQAAATHAGLEPGEIEATIQSAEAARKAA